MREGNLFSKVSGIGFILLCFYFLFIFFLTSGTCHGISWFCITISLQYSQSDRNWNAFFKGFPGGLDGKASACNVGGPGSIPGLERSPREGNNNPLQYSCLGNPMDGEAW